MVVVISANAYPVTLRIQEYMFSSCTVPPDSKETKLGSSNLEASPSAGNNTGVVLVPCYAWKFATTAISSGADISEVPGCHLI